MTGLFFLEALLLVSALSLDAFIASFSYGVSKIKIPFLSTLIITAVCSAVLAAALYLGGALSNFIPYYVSVGIAAAVLFTIGIIKLFGSFFKSYIKRHRDFDKKIAFKFFSLQFILNICADPTVADRDNSKTLSVGEAVGLAAVLSLDSLAVGFGAGLSSDGYLWIIGFSLLAGVLFVWLGGFLGRLLSRKTSLNLSWLSGVIFIGLGFMTIFL